MLVALTKIQKLIRLDTYDASSPYISTNKLIVVANARASINILRYKPV